MVITETVLFVAHQAKGFRTPVVEFLEVREEVLGNRGKQSNKIWRFVDMALGNCLLVLYTKKHYMDFLARCYGVCHVRLSSLIGALECAQPDEVVATWEMKTETLNRALIVGLLLYIIWLRLRCWLFIMQKIVGTTRDLKQRHPARNLFLKGKQA
jgi:hypothetical protein